MLKSLPRATMKACAAAALFVPSLHAPAAACDLLPKSRHDAIRIIDARTIELDDRSTLKLAAILPPTRYDSPAAPKDFASEQNARQALQRLAASRTVAFARERNAPDRYGRIIAQAFLTSNSGPHHNEGSMPNAPASLETWLQARLVAAGHARVTLTPELTPPCARHLLTREADAERNHRGLWREALYQVKSADDPRALLRLRSTFQIVTGTVHATAIRKSTVYLNFAKDWQRDFTVRISRRILKRAGLAPETVRRLTGRPIRVRGWIERRGGPLITVWRLEQIEVLHQNLSGQTERNQPLLLGPDLAATLLPATAPLPTTGNQDK